jgi:hypothetical protein
MEVFTGRRFLRGIEETVHTPWSGNYFPPLESTYGASPQEQELGMWGAWGAALVMVLTVAWFAR